jgi:hypothetical protein
VKSQINRSRAEGRGGELELASEAVGILEFVPTLAAWFLALRRSTIRLAPPAPLFLRLPLTLASSAHRSSSKESVITSSGVRGAHGYLGFSHLAA